MLSVYKYKDTTWTDLLEPTPEEIKSVTEKYNIDSLVAHELASPTLKHRAEARRHYVYLVMHLPVDTTRGESRSGREIDFVVGSDFIITTRYEELDAVARFAKKIEVDSILDKSPGKTRDAIFFSLLREVFTDLNNSIMALDDQLKNIETRIFKGKEREMVFALSEISRKLLNFRKTTLPYREILETLGIEGEKKFGEDFGFATRGVLDEYFKFEGSLHGELESVRELRETNNSLLTTKQNELVKTLTVLNVFTNLIVGFALILLGYLAIR
ncbi:CorA family divalent cation transporter [Candidatus Parcubacteria bacterium]|nr:CorA family divalent cation transporter [Candidatus Parcubacteria bacterium]